MKTGNRGPRSLQNESNKNIQRLLINSLCLVRFICKGFERSCHPLSVAGVAPLCQHDQNLCSLIICAEVMSRWLDCCELNMHVCRISGDILAEIIFIAVFSTGN